MPIDTGMYEDPKAFEIRKRGLQSQQVFFGATSTSVLLQPAVGATLASRNSNEFGYRPTIDISAYITQPTAARTVHGLTHQAVIQAQPHFPTNPVIPAVPIQHRQPQSYPSVGASPAYPILRTSLDVSERSSQLLAAPAYAAPPFSSQATLAHPAQPHLPASFAIQRASPPRRLEDPPAAAPAVPPARRRRAVRRPAGPVLLGGQRRVPAASE